MILSAKSDISLGTQWESIIGIGVLVISIFLSFSKYGNVVLGEPNEKPKYSFFVWGSMMFTCGLAADILFYSFAEWVMYATNPHLEESRNGLVFSHCFTGALFHGHFILYLQLYLDLCCMLKKEIDSAILKPAARLLENRPMEFSDVSLTYLHCLHF